MEESAIREGFAHLKPSTEYDALYNAALCRERADWMVGINASRLFSCLYGQPLAVGRVMTPVLAMTVVREAAIAAFVPEKFYTVALTLADGGTASSKRFAQKADAKLLLSKCRKEGRVTVQKTERKEKSENPPQLYDLTALQRDANRLLGFTAQQTLDYAQSLYEKRLITYPRTDSRFLTEDMAASLPGLVTDTGKVFAVEEPLSIHVQQVINGSKVTDHHALLPMTSLSHDVKTPLASLVGYLEAVESKMVTGAEKEEYIRVAMEKAHHLKDFVTALFEWVKLDAGEQIFHFEVCDLNELSRDIMADWVPLLENHDLSYEIEIPETEYMTRVDSTAYTRILNNLLQNILTHSDASKVFLTVTETEQQAKIVVADNGNGIAASDLPHIFERMYQCDHSRSAKGNGLGLSIAKELVSIHKGTITAASVPGNGTTFIIILPKAL